MAGADQVSHTSTANPSSNNNTEPTIKSSIGSGGESMMETVAEQVVGEGMASQLVLQQDQQVVMVTEGAMAGQQIVITEGGVGGLAPGTQVIQLGGGQTTVLDTSRPLKTEPEDLSVVANTARTTINLEAGAQAIQASAAAAVQNVIRSLKDSEKSGGVLQQILPSHLLGSLRDHGSILIVEGGGGGGGGGGEPEGGATESDPGQGEVGATPSKRSRTTEAPRLQIAKQYTPFGYHAVLEAATAQWVRKDEDRCTYLNKGQFYGLTLEFRPNPSEPFPGSMKSVKSVVMLVFRDAKNPEDELNAWDFWHQRQPTSKQRIIDAETNNMSDQCGITHIEDVSFNAIAVYWNPLDKPAFISCAIQCLSTDFSLQKGVKGLPMHLQVDHLLSQRLKPSLAQPVLVSAK